MMNNGMMLAKKGGEVGYRRSEEEQRGENVSMSR